MPRIQNALTGLARAQAIVGWESQETYPGTSTTVAQVAIFNEFGTKGSNGRPGIPQRPFMRQAYVKNLKQTIANKIEAHDRVMSGEWSVEKGLTAIGYRFQEALRSEMLRGDFLENAASTLRGKKAKGQGGRPLIATRRMLNALRTRIQLDGQPLGDSGKQDDAAATSQARADKSVKMKAAGEKVRRDLARAKDVIAKKRTARRNDAREAFKKLR